MEQEILIDTENREQQLAHDLIAHTNSSFFLTGRAGTGKTTFLHRVQQTVGKQFITLAPTGVAAILAGGETIHSFFGLPLETIEPGACGKMNEEKILALVHADTIIIDEVSMVRCDIVDAIDSTMRQVLRSTAPFGGKQMVFVGDMFQLPPVVRKGAETELMRDIYHTDTFYFFKAFALRRMRMVKIEFQKVYRQDDAVFRTILDHVRLNRVTPDDIARLNTRVATLKDDDTIITLVPTNRAADDINNRRLNALSGDEHVYDGTITGKFENKKFPVSQQLRLKVGAQVMFTRNDTHHRWANGTIATVSRLTDHEQRRDIHRAMLHMGCRGLRLRPQGTQAEEERHWLVYAVPSETCLGYYHPQEPRHDLRQAVSQHLVGRHIRSRTVVRCVEPCAYSWWSVPLTGNTATVCPYKS